MAIARVYPIDRARSYGIRRTRHAGDVASGPPNFNSAAPRSAYWRALDGEQTWLIETNGRGFVQALQAQLASAPSAQSYDGHTVDGSMVRVDGRWGPTTTRVLWTELRSAGADPGLLAAVSLAGRNRTITFPALVAAVWWLTWTGSTGAPGVALGSLRLPSGTVLPPWSALPPGDAQPVVATLQPTPPDVPRPPGPMPVESMPPAVPSAPAETPGSTAPSATPEPLARDTTDDLARPAGIEPFSTSNVPWTGLAVAAGVVALAWFLAKPAGKGRRG